MSVDGIVPATSAPRRGGNVEDAVTGRYDFSIPEVLSEAWQRVAGSKRVFVTVGVILFVGIAVVSRLLGALLFGASAESGLVRGTLFQIAMTAILYPFLVGVMMLGIRRAVDAPIDVRDAFGYLEHAGAVVVAAVPIALLTSIGFALLVLPGLYLSVAWLFALPLIVEKGLPAWEAMETSRRAVTHHWFKVFGALLVFGLIVFASAFTVVALIWTLPFWIIGYGVLYRIVFGVENPRAPGAMPPPESAA